MTKCFTGFGFGPIMTGLFAFEAHASGVFARIVVSEVDSAVVNAIRANGGAYHLNIAHLDAILPVRVEGIEIYNPNVAEDRRAIIAAIAASDEMATALPSVRIYSAGGDSSVAALIAEGIAQREAAMPTVVYAAENNNDAAILLEKAVADKAHGSLPPAFCVVDTVIGKMSGVVTSAATIAELGLVEMTPGSGRAILVEEFNRILIAHPHVDGWTRGISAFVEKEHLEPFEDAKLFGHNAIHALLAYLAGAKGYRSIAEAGEDASLVSIAREAFQCECGRMMLLRHRSVGDTLFTSGGWKAYAEDLIERMVNPNLNDLVERVGRDPLRKLAWNDRLVGTMRRCMEVGIKPSHLAMGAAAAVLFLVKHPEEGAGANLDLPDSVDELDDGDIQRVLLAAWGDQADTQSHDLIALVCEGFDNLRAHLNI